MITKPRLDLDKFDKALTKKSQDYDDKRQDARRHGNYELASYYASVCVALYETQIAFKESIVHDKA